MKTAVKEPEVLEHEPAQPSNGTVPATVANDSGALVSMIERVARDPTIDMDKMERLLAMQERVMSKQTEQAFNDAMSKAQGEMRSVAADSNNPQTKSKYASYAALDRALRPVYTRHGFSLSFDTEAAGEQAIRVVAYLSCSGHTRKYQVEMPADGKGAKGGDVMTKTHAVGAAMTYGQRYLLKLMFNMAVGDDDDGNSADTGDTVSSEQLVELQDLFVKSGAPKEKFLKHMKIESLAALPAAKFDAAKTALNNWKANHEKKATAQ